MNYVNVRFFTDSGNESKPEYCYFTDLVLEKGDLVVVEVAGIFKVVKVQRVSDADPHLLQHATKLGITLERKLAVKEKRNFDGSMVIRVGVKSEFISDQMARAIFVQKQGEHE